MYAVTLPLSGPLALPAAEGGESGDFWSSAYPILPHPVELIFGLVTFGILYWIVRTRVVPRLEEIYAERTAAIEGGIQKAEKAQADAAAALEQYNRQLATAREEAAKIREEARVAAQGIKDDILAQAHSEAERIAAAGRTQLEAQRQQIVTELRADLGRTSVDLASKIVGESLDDEARRQRTVERFLADLER